MKDAIQLDYGKEQIYPGVIFVFVFGKFCLFIYNIHSVTKHNFTWHTLVKTLHNII